MIEGLDNIPGIPPGSFAFYIKFHHAAIDGEGGTVVLQAIHSLSPDEDDDDGARRSRVRDREPKQVELYTRALINTVQRVPRAAGFTAKTAARLAGIGAGYMGQLTQVLQEAGLPSVETVKSKLRRPPVTRFSDKVSAHRVVELIGLPMADIKQVRRRIEGATINDVFMTTIGGALNEYLGAKGELSDRTMTAQVPMSLRGAEKGGEHGNQIGVAVMPLHTEIADPIARLHAIQQGGVKAKALVALVGKDLTKHVYDLLPAVASELFTTKVMLPTMNIVVSNVRGPDVPLYMAGAQMVAFAPVSIAMNGLGLNVTGFSYHGTLWICAVACRDMMPDPAFFAACVRSSFSKLVVAAERVQHETSGTQPARSAIRSEKVAGGSKARRKVTKETRSQAHGDGEDNGPKQGGEVQDVGCPREEDRAATDCVNDPLARPLRLPCGAVLPNRLCKAAMTEGVADPLLRATPRHETLYRAWSEGGAGLLLTGNVQIDRTDLERPVTLPSTYRSRARCLSRQGRRLRAWARAGTVAGNHLWMQISQAGWQSPRYVTRAPRAPSDVQFKLLGNYARPRPLREERRSSSSSTDSRRLR